MKIKFIVFLVLCLGLASGAAAQEITVPRDYPTIGEAITAAEAGDRIVVRPGRYHEQLVMKEGIELVSYAGDDGHRKTGGPGRKEVLERAENTIIDGKGLPPRPMVNFPPGITRKTILDGFTITGMPPVDHTKPGHAHTIECRGSSPIIRNNIIHGNGSTAIGSHATFKDRDQPMKLRDFRRENLAYSAAPLIENNVVYNNVGAGIGNNHYSAATLLNNEVFGHISEDNHPAPGIGIQHGASPLVKGNTVYNNDWVGIGCRAGSRQGRYPIDRPTLPEIVGNEVYGNGRKADKDHRGGIGLEAVGTPERLVLVENNLVYENRSAGIGARKGAYVLIKNNRSRENERVGIGFWGARGTITGNTVRFNKTSGIGIHHTQAVFIKDNLAEKNRQAGIGIDKSSGISLVNNKAVYSGHMSFLERVKTVLSPDLYGVGIGIRNSSDIYLYNNFAGHNKRPGIAITEKSKKIRLEGNQVVENGLAGTANLVILKGSQATLIKNSLVDGDKASIYVDGSVATLLENRIKGSGKPGLFADNHSRITARKNTITNSGAHGVYFKSSSGSLEDNIIRSSGHYGIKLEALSDLTVSGNKISGNGLWGGSEVGVENSKIHFENNELFNHQSKAPGFSAWGETTSVTVLNNKIIGTGCKISEKAAAYIEGNLITHNLKAKEVGVEISSGARALLLFNLITLHGRKGILASGGEITLWNNNIMENGLGIELDSPIRAVVQNNIIIRNRSGGIEFDGDQNQLILSHNDVWKNTNKPLRPKILSFLPEPSLKERNYIDCSPGQESLSVDPEFVSYEKGNHNLKKTSPCIKAGVGLPITLSDSKPNIGIHQ